MSDTAGDLIPLRALNQVGYCPRLYYLEYVEGLMPINEFVEDGSFQHRRLNDPQLAGRARKEGEALHTRSVALSSERLGLTGKLDLIEEKDAQCWPVEYKRSSGLATQRLHRLSRPRPAPVAPQNSAPEAVRAGGKKGADGKKGLPKTREILELSLSPPH